MSLINRFTAPDTRCLEKLEISTISEFDEIRRGSYISRDDSNGEVRFVIRDLEKFWVLTKITVLPFFRKFEFFRVLHFDPTKILPHEGLNGNIHITFPILFIYLETFIK